MHDFLKVADRVLGKQPSLSLHMLYLISMSLSQGLESRSSGFSGALNLRRVDQSPNFCDHHVSSLRVSSSPPNATKPNLTPLPETTAGDKNQAPPKPTRENNSSWESCFNYAELPLHPRRVASKILFALYLRIEAVKHQAEIDHINYIGKNSHRPHTHGRHIRHVKTVKLCHPLFTVLFVGNWEDFRDGFFQVSASRRMI